MAVFICSFVLLFIFCSALGFIQWAVWHTSSQQNYYWFICQLFLLPVNHLAFHSFTKSVCFVQQIVQNPTSVSAFPCTQQTLFLSAITKVQINHKSIVQSSHLLWKAYMHNEAVDWHTHTHLCQRTHWGCCDWESWCQLGIWVRLVWLHFFLRVLGHLSASLSPISTPFPLASPLPPSVCLIILMLYS